MDINSWWDMLTGFQRIYWIIAIPATLILLGMLVLTFMGADADADADMGSADGEVGADDGIGFQFFTFKNLVGFFTIFGWSGLACVDAGFSVTATLLISSICGVIMMALMASLFYFISRLAENGTFSMVNAIGRTGEVYLPIPESRGGFGKIQINVQSSLRTLQALTDDDETLQVGDIVVVRSIVNDNILLVSKKPN